MKLQGSKPGRKGHLLIATEVFFYLSCFLDGLTEINYSFVSMNKWFRNTNAFNLISGHDLVSNFFLLQIFEIAPSVYMVEVRKAGGDTLEFHMV